MITARTWRLALLSLLLSTPVAHAQNESPYGAPLGELYLSADSRSRVLSLEAFPFETFNFYLVAEIDFADIGRPELNDANGFRGWEAKLDVDPDIIVFSRRLNPPSALTVVPDTDNNWIVGTGMAVITHAEPFFVVEYGAMLLEQDLTNLEVSIGPSEPSSFAANGEARPGWLEAFPSGDCPDECLRPFARSIENRFVVNPHQTVAEFGEPLGSLYLSLAPDAQVPIGQIDVAAPFDFHLVTSIDYGDIGSPELNGVTGLRAWEASIDVPPEVTVLERTLHPPTSVNVALEDDNWIVGTGQMVPAGPPPRPLLSYRAVVFDASREMILSLRPSRPSSFEAADSGPAPGWQDWHVLEECTGRCLRTFAQWQEGHLTLQPFGGPSDYLLVEVGSGVGDASSVIEIPVVAWFPPLPKADPADFSGLDLELAWEGSLASLTDVRVAEITTGFEIAFNAGGGHAVISMATAEGIALVDRVPILTLVFTAGSLSGDTAIDVVAVEAFDGNLDTYPVDALPGSLTVGCTLGDVFPDGDINAADAIASLKIAIGDLIPTDEQVCAADMNHDEVINSGDTVLILRKAVGLDKAPESGPAALTLIATGQRSIDVELAHVAGLDLVLELKGDLAFDEVNASDGLVVAREGSGRLRLHFAAAEESSLPVRVTFRGGEGVVRVLDAVAHDTRGQRKELAVAQDHVVLGATPSATTALLGTVPNPFNPSARIHFRLAERGGAQIHILDPAGRRVTSFDLSGLPAGESSVTWNGQDDRGRRVASGVYFVQLSAAGIADTQRITLLK